MSPGLLLFIVVVIVVIVVVRWAANGFPLNVGGGGDFVSLAQPDDEPERPAPRAPTTSPALRLRRFDKGFSEPVFLEWASLLYVRAQEARGAGELDVLTPYFTPDALGALEQRDGQTPLAAVQGVVLGSVKLLELTSRGDEVDLLVAFHANYTVVKKGGKEQAWYAHEQWTFTRKRTAASRAPQDVEKLGCPSCGSPVERTALDRCAHCQAPFVPGSVDWSVTGLDVQELETRPPLLTGEVEEIGTDWPTVKSPTLNTQLQALQKSDPDFTPERFQALARAMFLTLQQGWSEQRWEKLRPNETDAVFQSHRFWLEAYKRQGLRNVLDKVQVGKVELVKVDLDQHYEAITCRIHARLHDSTVKVSSGAVVAGNPRTARAFTEYWTFIRARGLRTRPEAAGARPEAKCPNCGAPLAVSQAGVCESCDAKVTRGEFSWVLSRIEQDEEYTG
jgi:predicted lipid-binding transport protein (Tim44 family)